MTKKVLSVQPDEKLPDFVRLMSNKKLSCLLVVNENKPVGILTERDLVGCLSTFLSEQQKSETDHSYPSAAELMTSNLVTVTKQQTLSEALVVCVVNSVRHLPVVDNDGYLCGIITYTDIANELLEVNQQLQDLSLIDPLMGIGNRRAMEIDLKAIHALSQRYADIYSIVMIDIDFFKKYNDHYGHQAGDKTLQKVARCIKDCLRDSDRIFRYGGEEILVLLPQTGSTGAKILCERVLSRLHDEAISHSESPYGFVTVSCGIAAYENVQEKEINWSDTIKSSDQALYRAKKNGRNRYEI